MSSSGSVLGMARKGHYEQVLEAEAEAFRTASAQQDGRADGERPLLFVALLTCSCPPLIAAAAHLVVSASQRYVEPAYIRIPGALGRSRGPEPPSASLGAGSDGQIQHRGGAGLGAFLAGGHFVSRVCVVVARPSSRHCLAPFGQCSPLGASDFGVMLGHGGLSSLAMRPARHANEQR